MAYGPELINTGRLRHCKGVCQSTDSIRQTHGLPVDASPSGGRWWQPLSPPEADSGAARAWIAEEEDEHPEPSTHSLDVFLSAFPVPGEPWTHLFAMANYYSALLSNHPAPCCGDPPWLGCVGALPPVPLKHCKWLAAFPDPAAQSVSHPVWPAESCTPGNCHHQRHHHPQFQLDTPPCNVLRTHYGSD